MANIVVSKKPINTQIVIESIGPKTSRALKKLAAINKIKTHDQYNEAARLVKSLKEAAKSAKVEQSKITDPLELALENVNKHFDPFFQKVKLMDASIKVLMKEFLIENKKKLKQLEQDVETGKIKNISSYVEKAAALTIDSEDSSVRNTWKAFIDDENKIPRKFLVPNVSMITKHLREGGKPIPGVRWEQEESISI